jgi:hypothetical protein
MDEPNKYRISEEDIEVALRYLKYHDPQHATRLDAIAKLEDIKSDFHQLAHQNPDLLLKLQQEIDSDKTGQQDNLAH